MNYKVLIILLTLSTMLFSNTENRSIQGQYETVIPGEELNGTFELEIKSDNNEILFSSRSDLSQSESTFNKNNQFKSMYRKVSTDKFYSDDNPQVEDYFFAKLSDNKKELIIDYELKGKKTESKKVKVKKDFRIFNNLFYTLGKNVKNGAKDFKSFLVFPESASGYKASFKFYRTKNIGKKASEIYKNTPDFFLEGSKFAEEVIVCEVGLTGMAGKFFPHKFNFIFEASGDYNYLGYWGGHPDGPSFELTDRNRGDK